MTELQKLIKYVAIGLAVVLIVSIFAGVFSVVSLLGAISEGDDRPAASMQDYPLSPAVTELEIHIGAAELIIENGGSFSLSANLQDLQVEQRDGVLVIEEKTRISKNYGGEMVRLIIPEDTVFDKVTITTGAGRLQAGNLSARRLTLNLGAGQAVFRKLTADVAASISTGAGELIVEDGSVQNLDLDMGMGRVSLKSALTGESEIDQGVGEAELLLLGTAEDYTIRIEKGIGNATVDGRSIKNDETCGNGPARVEISGGIGSIRVSFQ